MSDGVTWDEAVDNISSVLKTISFLGIDCCTETGNTTEARDTFSTLFHECPYCGNKSNKRDSRGNCISCGGTY